MASNCERVAAEIAAERHVEDEHADQRSDDDVDHTDDQVRQQLAQHDLAAMHRRGGQLLHGAALPLPRDGE